MRYFLDTEFMENDRIIELLSIGLVAEDGRECYIQNRNADTSRANAFVLQHVLPRLQHRACRPRNRQTDVGRGDAFCRSLHCPWLWYDQISDCLLGFLAADGADPIFWGYYCAYDWVALCQLFGRMIDLPKGWPMYCRDLRHLLDNAGLEHVKQPEDMPHHALSDARWICSTLLAYERGDDIEITIRGKKK